MSKVDAVLENLADGTKVGVVTLLGSLCPVTLGHVQAFEEARKILLAEPGVARPARLETFGEVLGFVSLNGDRHVGSKLRQKGEACMDLATRWHLVELALEDHGWMELEGREGSTIDSLRARWPGLEFVHFCMNGADDVVRYRKYAWASPRARFITMGRPGFTGKVLEGMASCGVDPEAGHFILGPELPDISSTRARQALAASDFQTLEHMLHPRVIDWCLRSGPYSSGKCGDQTSENSSQHKVVLVRHGEGAHNAARRYRIRDPKLTANGFKQANGLRDSPLLQGCELLVVSPLSRAVQTAVALFGERPRCRTVLTALHTERWSALCDEGRPKSELRKEFPFLDDWDGWEELTEEWWPDEHSDRHWEATRVPAFCDWLRAQSERHRKVVVIGHGAFFRVLAGQRLRNCEAVEIPLEALAAEQPS